MSSNHRASTFPTCRPTSWSSGNRPRSLTTRTSSENGSVSSHETQRTSFTDEAQTSYNILLILRTDTQHLISLRNDNLAALEDTSGLTEVDASSRTALLACINESITAATRSITQMGPFLDKHRWPAAGHANTPESQRRSFIAVFKPRHRRSKSSSALAANPHAVAEEEVIFSPEQLFSWTLALTAQHTAVLVATKRLSLFLESGIANVTEEERRRRDARASWWEQGRCGFENVGLIQSLLGKPNSTMRETSAEQSTTSATNVTSAKVHGDDDGAAESLAPIMEQCDGRCETLFSEAFTPSTLNSTPKGLTARPRQGRLGSLQDDEELSVRRVITEPLILSVPSSQPSNEVRLPRMETFGSEKPEIPLSRFSSSRQPPRIATSPLPSAVYLQNALSAQPNQRLEQLRECPSTTGLLSEGDYLSVISGAPPLAHIQLGPTHDNIPHTTLTPLPSQVDRAFSPSPSPSPSPGTETLYTPYTPYTPLDVSFTSAFTQRALLTPSTTTTTTTTTSSKTLQPVIRELGRIQLISPEQGGAENIALRVSPIEANARLSIAPVIEGPDGVVVSPIETDGLDSTLAQQQQQQQQALMGVSPITITESCERALQDNDADEHVAWLVYMERKQEMSARRWSVRGNKMSGR